ncbi:kinase-like protein [Panus rudis PR-1116 ss-1]|nr:kinase-like protein [Panus rudis PR-1116 ss-1]
MIGGGEQSLHQRRYLCHKHILDLTKLLCYKIERLPSRLALQGVQLLEREPRNGGSFSDVYFGQYADTTVALKRLRVVQHNYHRFTAKKRFIREVLIWANLRPHSNVVPLLGTDAANFTHAPCIVLPWMRNGNLSSYLTNPANAAECNSPRMQQIASGLAYLHQHHIAHGDMRAANILLDHNLIAQITDFGLSRLASDYVTQVSSDGRAPYWLAPELHAPDVFGLEHARPRAEADVYAYACVCFELFTGSPPYSRLTAVQIWNRMQRGERPLRPVFHFTGHRMSDELWRVVEQCLSFRLHERPLSHALAEDLLLIEYACDDGM